MKHCPECNKNYADPTISFCLNDGTPLIFGQAVEEPQTAILSGDFPSEAPTRQIDPHTTAPTESFAFPTSQGSLAAGNRKLWMFGGLAIVLVAAGVFAYRYFDSAPIRTQIESVAVLPFENGSGDPDLDYLSDGLSESLIDKLSELPQLKVIARNSSFRYRGADIDLNDVANKLGVRAIVTGRVARVGENLNVRVEMIDAAQNRQLWSEQYDRKATDLLSIPRDIAQAASDQLRLKLSGSQERQLTKRETVNPQAYELLLKARYFIGKGGGSDNDKRSIEYLEQAVGVDASYALAHAELSIRYANLAGNSVVNPTIYIPKAESAARRALELDDDLAEAHLAILRVYVFRWQWQEAETEGKRAIELDPNNAQAHSRYAALLSLLARHDEAVAEARRAKELDPLSPSIAHGLGYRLYFARRYDEAIAELTKILELDPNLDYVNSRLGYAYAGKGQFKEAIAAYKEAIRLGDESTGVQVYLGEAYAKAGEREKAQEILKQLQTAKEYVSPGELASLYSALGDREAAFASLHEAYEKHDLQLGFLKVDPSYDPLRDDPRFQELLKKVGLG